MFTHKRLAAYNGSVKVIEHVGAEVHSMPDLYNSLRNETAALIHVKQLDSKHTTSLSKLRDQTLKLFDQKMETHSGPRFINDRG